MFATCFAVAHEPLLSALPLPSQVRMRRVNRLCKQTIDALRSLGATFEMLSGACRECGGRMSASPYHLCFSCAANPSIFCKFIPVEHAFSFLLRYTVHRCGTASVWMPKKRKVLALSAEQGKILIERLLSLSEGR